MAKPPGESSLTASANLVMSATIGTFAGRGRQSVNAYVISAGEDRHGHPRPWGKSEYVQAAIAALYPDILPRNVKKSKLTKDVNERLALDPGFQMSGLGPKLNPNWQTNGYHAVDRRTVGRALQVLRAANR
jgi:hypothetical protein